MQIVPVIDILGGVVVRAIGGRRDDYRPLITILTDDVSPLAIARAMAVKVNSTTIYVADIDAIVSDQTNIDLIAILSNAGFEVWADLGIASDEQLHQFDPGSQAIPVLGSETLRHLTTLNRAIDRFGPNGVIASVDLQNGKLLGRWNQWGFQQCPDAIGYVAEAYRRGVRRFIVLDLAAVGEGRGVPTLELCRDVKTTYPDIELIAGGGIRNRDDVESLNRVGVAGVLVSTAIHAGTLSRYS